MTLVKAAVGVVTSIAFTEIRRNTNVVYTMLYSWIFGFCMAYINKRKEDTARNH